MGLNVSLGKNLNEIPSCQDIDLSIKCMFIYSNAYLIWKNVVKANGEKMFKGCVESRKLCLSNDPVMNSYALDYLM